MDNRRSYTPTMYEGTPRRRASRKRMEELAKPRASTNSDVRISTIGRHLQWGGQEPINPIRTETLFAEPSERLERLSAPKRVYKGKLQDPEYLYSVFSAGKVRKQSVQDDADYPSDRVLELSGSKRVTPKYSKESRIDGEPIPMGTGNQESLWPIQKQVLLAKATPRLESLSEQKRVFQVQNINPEFMYSSSDISTMKYGVSDAAKKASASGRVAQLAEPKKDFAQT